ncbi:Fic family protein [Haliea sp. AH-315-K21]|uniref:Protein adenylyltransferase n=1 Tax=SAR86 cluster bacterium TaxID=2030880 RepID=A0A2A5CHB7_9GAMM|nr:Fic family protein [Haliea sp. AH-315-K21]MBN4075653.1 Fic family protein [Gammaproteobacteria bacterium AH-315-E17]PCJ42891.1 MAG: addiction module protein [SAR86 cluster bacterium]
MVNPIPDDNNLAPLPLVNESNLESVALLKQVARAHRYLAELKGVAKTIPNEAILISTLSMQEAKDSSAIENIFTTHDQLFQSQVLGGQQVNQATKEVENYRRALWESYQQTKASGLIRLNDILKAQERVEPNKPGLRKIPGTVIGNSKTGQIIYTPPQHPENIQDLMTNLVEYINDDGLSDLDPLIKMAIIHHQFESIHPFYDGNGRTGRILNILYLVRNQLLDLPILYLSRYIVETKDDYYRLLQSVREDNDWASWVSYIVQGIEETAQGTIQFVHQIRDLIMTTKQRMRAELPKIYSQELLNNLFFHPYTKVQFVIEQLGVSRITATKYLEALTEKGFITKHKAGRNNYYINEALIQLIMRQEKQ